MLVFLVGEACNQSMFACWIFAKTRKSVNLMTYGQSRYVL
jgi:hypothetical protein